MYQGSKTFADAGWGVVYSGGTAFLFKTASRLEQGAALELASGHLALFSAA